MARRVTSADVAREAGVSRATVSYVLNDTPHQVIPEATRQRVLDAVTKLGYTPSAAARALRRGRSDLVLVLLPDWPIGHNVGQLIERLSAALAEHQLTVVVHHHCATARPISEVWRAISPAVVIGLDSFAPADTAAMRAAGIEAVLAVLEESAGERDVLTYSQTRVGRLQVEHLASQGHRRIGWAWPEEPRVATFAALRLDGARRACADLGLPDPQVRTLGTDEQALEAVRGWRGSGDPVTAVAAYNDDVALQLLAAARAAGVDVPADLAVMGADDIPAARYAYPPLTTVEMSSTGVAARLTAHVLAVLGGREPPAAPGGDLLRLVRRQSG